MDLTKGYEKKKNRFAEFLLLPMPFFMGKDPASPDSWKRKGWPAAAEAEKSRMKRPIWVIITARQVYFSIFIAPYGA